MRCMNEYGLYIVQFNGDVQIAARFDEAEDGRTSHIVLRGIEGRKVGDKISEEESQRATAHTALTFTNEKSIDYLIEKLISCRKYLAGYEKEQIINDCNK